MNATQDIVNRDIKRELAVKLTNEDLLEIAIEKAQLEAQLEELETDFGDAKKEWAKRMEDVEKRIAVKGHELRSKEQKRVVDCFERFRAGLIETIRTDTYEVVETRAANLFEAAKASGKTLPTGEPAEVDPDELAQRDAAKAQKDVGVAEDENGDVIPVEDDGSKRKSRKK